MRPLDPPEESALNLTPMIDVVFNLVTFFLIATDLSHKDFLDVALPRAASAAEDVPGQGDRRVVVSVARDGRLHLRGQAFALETGDPSADAAATTAFESALADAVAAAARAGEEAPPLLVRGDRDVLWRHVQRLLAAAASPRVRIARVQFAVSAPPPEGGTGAGGGE
jgi:biopolymer transport protein ExbD